MKVCIAEKPSVAREIAAVVGANERKNGYLEGNGYQVTWTFGHLCTLKEPGDYTDAWKSWSVASLPIIPCPFKIKLIDIESYKNQFAVIESLFSNADEIINCGDAGQEGELIQRWVMHQAKASCPVKRLWISSLTEDAIKEGFNSLRPAADFDNLYIAGLARAIGDWLLGINATRIYTLRCSSSSANSVISIGRVQTPTLAIIVNRYKEIQNFVPTPFWELKTIYRNVVFNALNGKFNSIDKAEEILSKIKDNPLIITSITEKKGVENAPKLFDLTSLQVECNKKFSFSADDTLKLIQSLYEKKFTTYPRVDTSYLSDDLYPKIPTILKGLHGYEHLSNPILDKKLPKSKRVFDNSKVTDHHAIIPTGYQKGSLTDDERKVYNLVVLHFIANFYPEAKILTTTVLADVDDVKFKATGKQIQSPGWRVVFNNLNSDNSANATEAELNAADETDDKPKEQVLPKFTEGEKGPHTPQVLQKTTTPPKYYTEATLLRAMETAGKFVDNEDLRDALKENGIGRPSTRAAIIETLFKRNYIVKEKKNLIPTERGIQLVEMINYDLLKSAELTGLWERKLRDIEKGNYKAEDFIAELKNMVIDLVNMVKTDNSLKSLATVTINDKKSIKGKKPSSHSNSVKSAVKVGDVCPLCRKGRIIKGKTMLGCDRFREGCNFRAPLSQSDANR